MGKAKSLSDMALWTLIRQDPWMTGTLQHVVCSMLTHGQCLRPMRNNDTISLSSTKVKYKATTKEACGAVWLRKMLANLQLHQDEPTTLFRDNKEVLKLAKNCVFYE
jgi:hypothetical protein